MVNRPAAMGAKVFEASAIVKCYACRKARRKSYFILFDRIMWIVIKLLNGNDTGRA